MKAMTKGQTVKKQIEYETQPMDAIKGIAKFPIKFLAGTRKSCVTLRFVMQVKVGSVISRSIESNSSQPFIVITNDCQWEGSEGTLLKNDAFSEQIEIQWPHFVNILQRHFLRATRQLPLQPARALSMYDFEFLNKQFFGDKQILSHKHYDSFWTWFGKSLQTLRYKRHIATLWQNGLITMFISRDRVQGALKDQGTGCFMILFSAAYPGQLEIAYNSETGDTKDGMLQCLVKFYLVQPNDTSGSKRTLPDFLNECRQFSHLLQQVAETPDGPIYKRYVKDQVLEPYYSKQRNSFTVADGYEPLNVSGGIPNL